MILEPHFLNNNIILFLAVVCGKVCNFIMEKRISLNNWNNHSERWWVALFSFPMIDSISKSRASPQILNESSLHRGKMMNEVYVVCGLRSDDEKNKKLANGKRYGIVLRNFPDILKWKALILNNIWFQQDGGSYAKRNTPCQTIDLLIAIISRKFRHRTELYFNSLPILFI